MGPSTSANRPAGRRGREWSPAPPSHSPRVSSAMRRRRSTSRTTTNTQGWAFSALGAWTAASSIRATSSSGTGSGAKSRHARWRSTTSKKAGPWPKRGQASCPPTSAGQGQDLGAAVVDQERVLELCRPSPVDGDRCPAVAPELVLPGTHGDHRLDGERHPRLDDGRGPRVVVVRDLQVAVELLADAVAD